MASGKKVLALSYRALPPTEPLHWTATFVLAGQVWDWPTWASVLLIISLWVLFLLRLVGTQQIDIFETWRDK